MRVTLVYPDLDGNVNFPVGLGLVSACLQEAGHETRIMHLNQEKGFPFDLARMRAEIEEFRPGLIGFSTTTPQAGYALQAAGHFKTFTDAPIVFGGIHATIAPEKTLASGHVDYVVRGEGERAMVELAGRIERGEDAGGIANLAYMSDGRVTVNPLGPLVEDLDSLPFPDRRGFDFGHIVSLKNGWASMMAGRGCPYSCTYCVNNYYHSIYSGMSSRKGHLRIRSVPVVLEEIAELLQDFGNIRLLSFDDDLFTQDESWLEEFCEGYMARFSLPLACNVRVNLFNERIARMLAGAGFREIKIGLESGSERVRRDVLNRRMSDESIINAFRIAEENGLRAWSLNMVGIPTETKQDILDTVRLNAKIRPYILRCSIFYPFEGTELHGYCEERGMLDEARSGSLTNYFDGSVLKLDGVSPVEIYKAKRMFKWFVDSESDIEAAGIYKMLVEQLSQLPDEQWAGGQAREMVSTVDQAVDSLMKLLGKEHYSSRKHLDLNYTPKLGFELPDA